MSEPMETIHDPNGVVSLARRAAPHLHVVSASEATIRSRNVIGAGAGAGLAAWFDAPLAGAAIGGGFMLAVFVAIWLTFAKLGDSEAYRQTFVEPHVSELTVVSFHTDDEARADDVLERLHQREGVTVKLFDESLSQELRP